MRFGKILGLLALSAFSNAYEAVKDYCGTDGFKIGIAANTMYFNNNNYINAIKNFNIMVAENGCKLSGIQQSKGNYNFSDCDNHLKKAKELGMEFRFHCLVWHSYQPGWFENADSNTLKNAIVEHIQKVMTHYKGQIRSWDVVNEAVDDSSNGNGYVLRNSFLLKKVPNFIELAFETAHKTSPDSILFYNDYNAEGVWGKSESIYNFIKEYKGKGVPISGIGLQYHVSVQNNPQYSKINSLMQRYCALGLELHITEMDVNCENQCWGSPESAQSTVFTNAMKACLANKCCKTFIVWGVSDRESWLGEDKKGLLFTSGSYQPKAQYTALLNLLKENLGKTGNATPTTSKKTTTTKKDNQTSGSCWSKSLGYDCCPDGVPVYYTDNDGKWGVFNDNWCGVVNSSSSSAKCFSIALGYPCCSSGAVTYFTDADGKWGVENDNWCGIN